MRPAHFLKLKSLPSYYLSQASSVYRGIINATLMSFLARVANAANITDRRTEVTLEALKNAACKRVLSDEEAFNTWLVNLRWTNYKKKVAWLLVCLCIRLKRALSCQIKTNQFNFVALRYKILFVKRWWIQSVAILLRKLTLCNSGSQLFSQIKTKYVASPKVI